MSEYCEVKAIRFRPTEEFLKQLKVSDLYDLTQTMPKVVGYAKSFEVCGVDNGQEYLDLICEENADSNFGEFYKVRLLTDEEAETVLDLFDRVFHYKAKREDFRYVHYCWYNCSEPEDCFDINPNADEFYQSKVSFILRIKKLLS